MWSFLHPVRRVCHGKILRLILAADATVLWSDNVWASTNKSEAIHVTALNVWFVDLPTEKCPSGAVLEFTFFWKKAGHWEGGNYSVAVGKPGHGK